MPVDLRRLHGFMAEPERDHRALDTLLQQGHGAASQAVMAGEGPALVGPHPGEVADQRHGIGVGGPAPRRRGGAAVTAVSVRIRDTLVGLRMPRALEVLDRVLQRLEQGELSARYAIDQLLLKEYTAREGRRVQRALYTARLAPIKTQKSFDFTFRPAIERSRIDTLATGAWMLANGNGIGAIHDAWPVLTVEQIEAAALYARAYPQRGRPRTRPAWRSRKPAASGEAALDGPSGSR